MKLQHTLKTFNELSEEYSTWVIKYCSTSLDSPLFLIWYSKTDEPGIDSLLTYKSGEIFVIKSLADLKSNILASLENLNIFDRLDSWLDNFNNLEIKEYSTYDLISIENNIKKNILDIPTIEGIANFINLYLDFLEQDEKNTELQVYSDHKLIKKTYNYFYNYIFWPRFNDSEKFKKWDRPQLVIDKKKIIDKSEKHD
jgi:hypothetical protein